MRETIIRTSEPFDLSLDKSEMHFDNEDISTLGSKQVYEAVVFCDDDTRYWNKLMGYDVIAHIDCPLIISETISQPNGIRYNYRQATIDEIKETILNLIQYEKMGYITHTYVETLRKALVVELREEKLNKLSNDW